MDRHSLRKIRGENCHYCGTKTDFTTAGKPNSASVEHLIHAGISGNYKRRGGTGNCVIACNKCNNERDIQFRRENETIAIEVQYVNTKKNMARAIQAGNEEKARSLEAAVNRLESNYSFLLFKIAAQICL